MIISLMDDYSKHIITGDTGQNILVLNQLFDDNLRYVPLDKLKLPKTMPEFKLRDIIQIAEKIKRGEIDDTLLVNEEFMIVKGIKRYYALKYLGEKRIKVRTTSYEFPNKNNFFSIRK